MLNFQKLSGLLPAIIQDAQTRQVLMLGFMNEEAYQKTIASQTVWFWSRTKKRLWQKGEESGNILNVISIQSDCDDDTLLLTVRPEGPTCHTGKVSCFSSTAGADPHPRRFDGDTNGAGDVGERRLRDTPDLFLSTLFALILSRQKEVPPNSYTTTLFQKGLNHICEKVAEESEEVIRAAQKEGKQRTIEESADLFYHLMVLLAEMKINWAEVILELKKRSQ